MAPVLSDMVTVRPTLLLARSESESLSARNSERWRQVPGQQCTETVKSGTGTVSAWSVTLRTGDRRAARS